MKIIVGALAVVSLATGAAHADRKPDERRARSVAQGKAKVDHASQADRLFQKGKKLLTEKKYADACPTFEEVDKLDPGIGAKLNVAKCYEDWGRLATAYRWYVDAGEMAKTEKDERGPKIKELVDELDSNVPRLTLKVRLDADPDVLATLKMDGKVISPSTLNSEMRVDPGPHSIEFEVDGKVRRKMAPVERGGESEITLDIPKDDGTSAIAAAPREPVGPPKDTPVAPGPEAPGRTRKIIGISVAGAGVVALGVAGIVTLAAKSKYSDALDANCMGSPSMCDDVGLADTRDARSSANVATVVTLFGLAAVGTGIVLYLTAPKGMTTEKQIVRRRKDGPLYVAPVVSGSGGGFALGGSF